MCGRGRLHAGGVQVADAGACGGEVQPPHHRELRRPVLRPDRRPRRQAREAAEPDVLPAVAVRSRHRRGAVAVSNFLPQDHRGGTVPVVRAAATQLREAPALVERGRRRVVVPDLQQQPPCRRPRPPRSRPRRAGRWPGRVGGTPGRRRSAAARRRRPRGSPRRTRRPPRSRRRRCPPGRSPSAASCRSPRPPGGRPGVVAEADLLEPGNRRDVIVGRGPNHVTRLGAPGATASGRRR